MTHGPNSRVFLGVALLAPLVLPWDGLGLFSSGYPDAPDEMRDALRDFPRDFEFKLPRFAEHQGRQRSRRHGAPRGHHRRLTHR